MKKILQFSLLIFALLMCFDSDLYGQRRGKKKKKKKSKTSKVDDYFDESGGFKHRLWYGGGGNLGFSGNGRVNSFVVGLSPMVGYKIFDELSVGPRLAFDVSFIRGQAATSTGIAKAQPLSYSFGVFGRYKIFNSIFTHIEYGLENNSSVFVDGGGFLVLDGNGDVFVEREVRDNFYLGLGYNSGGGLWGYEIYVLYNALAPENTINLPFDIRFGLTYNF